MNTSLALIFTLFILITPPIGYLIITRNLKHLNSKKMREKYEVFYSDNKVDTRGRALYTIYFLTRRLFSALVLVFLNQRPFF